MGELKTRADGLERNIILISRELDGQKKKVEGIAAEIKYIAGRAEGFEEENVRLKKQLDDQQKQFEKDKVAMAKQN